ncbi:MAG: hypothetical protein M1834_001211 [Cirrosporium novae-zelandiae]|nr:MAG: hypothetical protein M1834_001211 [Cirrosporium novae-zelandiae]
MDRNCEGLTYRVRKLPHYMDKLEVIKLLVSLGLGPLENIKTLCLASSLNPYERPPTKTATAEFMRRPQALPPDRQEWVLPTQDVGLQHNVIIDLHFLGFTALNDVGKHLHTFDCIAISGLASHPFGSWKHRSKDSTFMWLRDQLPRDLPQTRNIIYGYDTQLVMSQSFQTINDLAISFIVKLKSSGRSLDSAKPVVLLAHSLGGIILKQALVLLANGTDLERAILHEIQGIIFFGVPNKGMEMSHLMSMVEGQPNTVLVEPLCRDSGYLSELDNQFNGITLLQDIRVISVYETKLSHITQLSPSGTWSRTGRLEVLVNRESAIQQQSNQQDHFPINENHSDMVKFAEDDANYKAIMSYLCSLCNIAEGEYDLGHDNNLSLKRLNAAPSEQPAERKEKSLENKMMKSLSLAELRSRFEDIDDAYHSTQQWIFNDPKAGLAEWLRNGRGIFWISGKPGSGKSTLMKSIVKNQQTSRLLHDWSENKRLEIGCLDCRLGGKGCDGGTPVCRNCQSARVQCTGYPLYLCAEFFFHDRGPHLQKSFEGLLRSILYQVLSGAPMLRKFVLPIYLQQEDRLRSYWTLDDLEACFDRVLQQDERPVNIHLFLDALDEFDGPKEIIVAFVQRATKLAASASTRLRICFSSRPWDIFMRNFETCPGFKIHEFTRQDIWNYVGGKMMEKSSLSQSYMAVSEAQRDHQKNLLVLEIIEKAQGVFLWVKLVIQELTKASAKNASPQQLLETLKSLPGDLEQLYERIVDRIPEGHRATAYSMLEIVLRSSEELDIYEFIKATECADCDTFDDCQAVFSSNAFIYAGNNDHLQSLLDPCGGLIEILHRPKNPIVQFMHQSAKDFVSKLGFGQRILKHSCFLTVSNGYSFMCKYALTKLTYDEKPQGFLRCMQYAFLAESTTGSSQRIFFDSFPEDGCGLDLSLNEYINTKELLINSIVGFAVMANLKRYMREKLQSNSYAEIDPHQQALHCLAISSNIQPLRSGSELTKRSYEMWNYASMVSLLINHGASKDKLWKGQCPFQTIFYQLGRASLFPRGDFINPNQVYLARSLLEHGQNPNTKITVPLLLRRPTPIYHCTALHVPNKGLIETLIKFGADINALDDMGRTPLDSILRSIIRAGGGATLPDPPAGLFERMAGLSELDAYEVIIFFLDHGGCVTRAGKQIWMLFIQKVGREVTDIDSRLKNPPLLHGHRYELWQGRMRLLGLKLRGKI